MVKQSQLLIPTLKEEPSDAEAPSHKALLRAGYIIPVAAGMYTYLPLAYRVLKNITRVIKNELDSIGASEILMPTLVAAQLWEKSGRYKTYGPELYKLKNRHQTDFILGPTHEETAAQLAKDTIHSARQLPLIVYQIQSKYRDEERPRYGMIRAREFLMLDGYSFNLTEESLDDTFIKVESAFKRIFDQLHIAYRVISGEKGEMGSKSSKEFIVPAQVGEEKITSSSNANQNSDNKIEKGIEVGHIFKLGDKYSNVFKAQVKDSHSKDVPILMGSYGIGISRLVSAIAEQHLNKQGLNWPLNISPFKVHLVPINYKNETQKNLTDKIENDLNKIHWSALVDDRKARPGVKFADADLIGIPIRIIIGRKASDGIVEVKIKPTDETIEVPVDKLIPLLQKYAPKL